MARGELVFFFNAKSQICEYRTQILELVATYAQHRPRTFPENFKSRNNKTPEHRTEEAAKALFWKSALIMASRYPRERAEVDRKKRRAADTTHFLFPCISSL